MTACIAVVMCFIIGYRREIEYLEKNTIHFTNVLLSNLFISYKYSYKMKRWSTFHIHLNFPGRRWLIKKWLWYLKRHSKCELLKCQYKHHDWWNKTLSRWRKQNTFIMKSATKIQKHLLKHIFILVYVIVCIIFEGKI